MPKWSRRRALQAVGSVALTALAGCSGASRFEDESREERGDPVTDYDLLEVRASEPAPLLWRDERPEDETQNSFEHVRSEDDLAAVTFASERESATDLASFLRSTNYENESVLVSGRAVRACYEVTLQGVRRSEDSVDLEFCSSLRPADVACESSARDRVVLAVRLPFVGEGVSSYGSSYGSDCDERPSPLQPSTPSGGDGA